MNRLTRKTSIFVATLVLALFCTGAALAAAGYSLFGDATLVSPGFNSATAAQIRSDASIPPGYGGVDFGVPALPLPSSPIVSECDFNLALMSL